MIFTEVSFVVIYVYETDVGWELVNNKENRIVKKSSNSSGGSLDLLTYEDRQRSE